MNIRDATIEADKIKGFITRDSIPDLYFEPTNTAMCTLVYKNDGTLLSRRWNPNFDDLVATDWKAISVSTLNDIKN